ncbi:MAG: hypothetical protein WBW81_16675, partial [Methylocella sp.]
ALNAAAPGKQRRPGALPEDKAHAETDQTSKSNQTEPFDRSVQLRIRIVHILKSASERLLKSS